MFSFIRTAVVMVSLHSNRNPNKDTNKRIKSTVFSLDVVWALKISRSIQGIGWDDRKGKGFHSERHATRNTDGPQ